MKTWPLGGKVSRLSSNENAEASEASGPEAEGSSGPSDDVRSRLLDDLTAELGDALLGSHFVAGTDITIRVASDAWAETAALLKHKLGFEYFGFLSAIDWLDVMGRDMDSQVDLAPTSVPETSSSPSEESALPEDQEMETGLAGGRTRFQVFARVNDVANHRSVTIKADVPADTMAMSTWVNVYAGANWHERETAEMFGIDFVGHPGLSHIYLPGEFEGHPLRKDYPLLARRIKPWPGIVDVELIPEEAEAAGIVGGTAAGVAEGTIDGPAGATHGGAAEATTTEATT